MNIVNKEGKFEVFLKTEVLSLKQKRWYSNHLFDKNKKNTISQVLKFCFRAIEVYFPDNYSSVEAQELITVAL